jgi:hypothetical protein
MSEALNLKELKQLASDATKGDWPISYSEGFGFSESFAVSQGPDLLKEKPRDVYQTEEGIKARQQMRLDAHFISASNPETVIKLIDEIRLLRAALDFYSKSHLYQGKEEPSQMEADHGLLARLALAESQDRLP